MRGDERTLPPTSCVIGWPSLSSAGELILMVQIRGSQKADQQRYHLVPDPELRVASHPKISIIYIWLGHMKGPVLLFQNAGFPLCRPTTGSLGGVLMRI